MILQFNLNSGSISISIQMFFFELLLIEKKKRIREQKLIKEIEAIKSP